MDEQELLIDLLEKAQPSLRDLAIPGGRGNRARVAQGYLNAAERVPDGDFLRVQDAYLARRRALRGVVDAEGLPRVPADARISLWQGDITRLACDAIVNAANSSLLGCRAPCHDCIDNAIHTAAGLQLRDACRAIIAAQGHPEPTGRAQITPGYHLPARFVLHTVGPIVSGSLTDGHRAALASCYRACLRLAAERGLHSVAFCCISTGVFRFPAEEAARIAVRTVREALDAGSSVDHVIFNVFSERSRATYAPLLGL